MNAKNFIGKTIKNIRLLTEQEVENLGWERSYGSQAIVIEFSDGSWLVPSRDSEANGPGALLDEESFLRVDEESLPFETKPKGKK